MNNSSVVIINLEREMRARRRRVVSFGFSQGVGITRGGLMLVWRCGDRRGNKNVSFVSGEERTTSSRVIKIMAIILPPRADDRILLLYVQKKKQNSLFYFFPAWIMRRYRTIRRIFPCLFFPKYIPFRAACCVLFIISVCVVFYIYRDDVKTIGDREWREEFGGGVDVM